MLLEMYLLFTQEAFFCWFAVLTTVQYCLLSAWDRAAPRSYCLYVPYNWEIVLMRYDGHKRSFVIVMMVNSLNSVPNVEQITPCVIFNNLELIQSYQSVEAKRLED